MITEIIAAKLRMAMAEKDQSLTEFSQELGIARSTLQEYLRGTSNPRADTIELIAEKLHCTPAELVTEPNAPPPRADLHPSCQPVWDCCRMLEAELARLSREVDRLDRQ